MICIQAAFGRGVLGEGWRENTLPSSSSFFYVDERNEQSDLDVSTLALAPTQAYGQFAELETQAYPTVTDSDPGKNNRHGYLSKHKFISTFFYWFPA